MVYKVIKVAGWAEVLFPADLHEPVVFRNANRRQLTPVKPLPSNQHEPVP